MKPTPKLYLFAAFMLLAAYILIGCTGSRFGSPCPSTGKQKMIGYGSYYRYSPLRDRWVLVYFDNCSTPVYGPQTMMFYGKPDTVLLPSTGNNCPEGRPGCIVHHGQVNDSIFSLPAMPNVIDTLSTYRPYVIKNQP